MTIPSGTLPPVFIIFAVTAATKFPPAESPIKMIFFGMISKHNFYL